MSDLFDDAKTVGQVLGQLAGFASLCWVDRVAEEGKYGRPDKMERVFDSERAAEAVRIAEKRVAELTDRAWSLPNEEELQAKLYAYYCANAGDGAGFYYAEAEEAGLLAVYKLGLEQGQAKEQ